MDDGLTIAEVARRTGLTTQTLRSYERSGLLGAASENGGAKRNGAKQNGSAKSNGAKSNGAKSNGAKANGAKTTKTNGGKNGKEPGERRYTDEDVAWIRLLARLKATGMPNAEVREFVKLSSSGPESARRKHEMLVAHRQQVLDRIAQLHEDLALIEYQIQQLQHPRNGGPRG